MMDEPEMEIFYFRPRSALLWESGNRGVTCLAWDERGLMGSVKD